MLTESQAGRLIFLEVVRRAARSRRRVLLLQSGFYTRDGKIHVEKMTLRLPVVAEEFSPSGLIAAIRGVQADTIRYLEFVKRSTAAGVIAYWSFLTARKSYVSVARRSSRRGIAPRKTVSLENCVVVLRVASGRRLASFLADSMSTEPR